MALSVTARGTWTNNTANTSFTVSPTSNFAAGLAVLIVAADNSASAGSSNNLDATLTDSLGNTWTKRASAIYDNGAANAGVQGAIYTCDQSQGLITTGTTVTIGTSGTTTTAKTGVFWQVSSDAVGGVASYLGQAVGAGASTASPTITTSSITNGHAIIAAVMMEAGTTQTHTRDSDTTDGAWSAGAEYIEVGTTTSGSVVASQAKVVTATATQTYNPTLGLSVDTVCAWISVAENIVITGAAPTALTLTTFAPTIRQGVAYTPSTAALTLTGYAPTIKNNQITARGTWTNNTANTSFTVSPNSNFAAGLAVLVVAADNGSLNGATEDLGATLTDSLGNTWTKQTSGVFDNGAASAGLQTAIYTTDQSAGLLTTSTTVTITTGASATAKAGCFWEVAPRVPGRAFWIERVDTEAGVTTPNPSISTGASIPRGSVIIAAVGSEYGISQSVTDDSDTTDGIWSASQYAEVGVTATGVACVSQAKVATGYGQQVYNPTFGTSSDTIASYIVVRDEPLVVESRGTWTNNASATTVNASPTQNFGAGLAVLCVAADNSVSGGATNNFVSPIVDSLGNVWTLRAAPIFDNGVANAGVQGAIYTTDQSAGLLTTGTTVPVEVADAAVAWTGVFWEIASILPDTRARFVTSDVGAGQSATTAPTITTSTIQEGDALIAMIAMEAGTTQTYTNDADEENGSWAPGAGQYAEVGTTTAGSAIISQTKVFLGTGTATHDPTLGVAADTVSAWASFRNAPYLVPPTTALTITTYAPSIALGGPQVATPTTKALALSAFAPTVATPRLCTPTAVALVTAPLAPVVSTPRLVTPTTASLSLSAFAPAVATPRLMTPATLALTTARFAPSITVGVRVTPTTKSLVTASFAPTVATPRLCTPPTASVATSAFAPSISVGIRTTPTTKALTLTAFAPTVATPRLCTPTTKALVLATFAPTSVIGYRVVPTTKALALAAFAPSAIVGYRVVPTTKALTLTTFAPSAIVGYRVVPTTLALVDTQFTPSVVVGHRFVPATRTLTTSAFVPTVSTPRLVTPGTLALIDTQFAPSAIVGYRVVPTTKALTLTTFVPTVSTPRLMTPATLALTTARFAPSITVGVRAVPTTASLSLSAFVPTVSTPRLVTPGTLALATTRFAPVLKLSVIPPTKALTTSVFAPTVTAPRLVTPATASLATASFVPTVATPRLATPPTKALTLTTFAPTAVSSRLVVPTTASLTLATFAPTVATPRLCTPATASLTTTRYEPVLVVGLTPSPATLTLSAFAPTVATPRLATPTTASLTTTSFAVQLKLGIVPPTKALTLTTFAPTVAAPRLVTPATATLSLSTFAPTIGASTVVTPTTKALTLTTFAPTALVSVRSVPATATLSLAAFAPTARLGFSAVPSTVALATTGFAPTASAPRLCTPPTAVLATNGFAPVLAHGYVVAQLALALAAFEPTVSVGGDVMAIPPAAALALSTYAPFAVLGGDAAPPFLFQTPYRPGFRHCDKVFRGTYRPVKR